MKLSTIGKTLGMAGAAASMAVVAQAAPAAAATSNWSTARPALPNVSCSAPVTLDQGPTLASCVTYGDGEMQAFAVAYNVSNGRQYLPDVTSIGLFNASAGGTAYGDNSCAAWSSPAQSARWCNGPVSFVPTTCTDVFASVGYTWNGSHALWSPVIRICP